MEYGKVQMESPILANGKAVKRTAMESMCGSMEIAMKESGDHVFAMVTGLTSFRMEMFTLVSISMASRRATVSTSGQMGIYIKVLLSRDSSMVMANGRRNQQ